MNDTLNSEDAKKIGDKAIDPYFRERLINFYTNMIAFVLGIVSSLITSMISSFPRIVRFAAILVLLYISSRFIKQVSELYGAESPKAHEEKKYIIKNPYEIALKLFEEIRKSEEYYPYLGFRISGWKKLFLLSGIKHSLILLITFFIITFIPEEKQIIPTLLWTIYFVWISNSGKIRDRAHIYIASRLKAKVYFLITGKRFLDPNEYYLVIDFKDETFFFAFYYENIGLESDYIQKIGEISHRLDGWNIEKLDRGWLSNIIYRIYPSFCHQNDEQETKDNEKKKK